MCLGTWVGGVSRSIGIQNNHGTELLCIRSYVVVKPSKQLKNVENSIEHIHKF